MLNMASRQNRPAKTLLQRLKLGLQAKLLVIFLSVKIIPLLILTGIAWWQISFQGDILREIATRDSAAALNEMAVDNLKILSIDTATQVANFLYSRDDDALYVAHLKPTKENYHTFVEYSERNVINTGQWVLDPAGRAWTPSGIDLSSSRPLPQMSTSQASTEEINYMNGFRHHPQSRYDYQRLPIYDEITFIDLNGQETIKVQPRNSSKIHYPLDPVKKDISKKENTYIKAENYFDKIKDLQPGEIYVSDVIGAHVRTNYIGLYTPEMIDRAATEEGYEIEFAPEEQAYSSGENPVGRHFEGIIRWVTPAVDENGKKIGYVSLALNHIHLMWMVIHITPQDIRSRKLPEAMSGNYAHIWDYKSRNIAHPRHHAIVGFDPQTGDPAVPMLEESIYQGWMDSGLEKWTDYVQDYPLFYEQSRNKKPAADLIRQGSVGLDGRYLNHAPQNRGWMILTKDGGSGSFYTLVKGLYKISAAAAIPYYTGQYAPSEQNNFSKRGFGFIAIDSDLEFFTAPTRITEKKLITAINESLNRTFFQLVLSTLILASLMVFIAVWTASFLTSRITDLIGGMSRFRAGERQFRFNTQMSDEFGTLADSFDDMADSIVNSVKDPLSILDMDKNIIYMNEHSLVILNKTLAQVVGLNYSENSLYPADSKYAPLTALEENREAAVTYIPQSQRYVRPEARILTNNKGQPVAYIIETTDITEMVTRQMALEKAINVANQANAHKGDFLARMSHEIRTPMNAIIGLSQIVRKYLDTIGLHTPEMMEAKDHMHQVEISSQHLLGLLNDILDVSKIEAGKISFSQENFVLFDLIKTVSSIIKPRCDEKNISFNIFRDIFNPCTFLSDPLRLRQVLINLLANAVKFTQNQGAIELHIKNLERQDGRTKIQFIINDTGIGISEKALADIFKPFEQATSNISSQYGGTGLGLTISGHIISIFGGRINVKSNPGQGSEFEFSIWLHEVATTTKARAKTISAPSNELLGKRVLLVDDVDLNRIVAKAMMKPTGITIDEATDGQDALDMFTNSPQNTYDIILMDVQMPKMDGYQATRAIRALDRNDAATVPIIALTANAFTADAEKATLAGMDAHLAKPVKLETLLELLFSYVLK